MQLLTLLLLLIGLSGWLAGCDVATENIKAHAAQATPRSADSWLHHDLQVKLHPATGELAVTDTVTLQGDKTNQLNLRLHPDFSVQQGATALNANTKTPEYAEYTVALNAQHATTLSYRGRITSTPDCDWLRQACALLNERGVYLDANSQWYPYGNGLRHTFSLNVEMPNGWVSLSQGQQHNEGWQELQPQQGIYLIAGKFHVYQAKPKQADIPTAMVYLQQDDPELAERYLQASTRYLDEYSRLLGAYPYAKFATVESFWETGWGMPSFTLLGPRVLRLPFIPHTSLPHEILHNWWGNGVYVDYTQGNWSEGLTAYLADHRRKMTQGEDAAYRRDTLQQYAEFTRAGGDFPLNQFRSRHDRTTQAIGYGKALMLFHMLHEKLGDALFFQGLRQFYQDYRFRHAGYTELQQALSTASGQDLSADFTQWLTRTGAPQLSMEAEQPGSASAKQLNLTLNQTQASAPFRLDIPIKLSFADGSETRQVIEMSQRQQSYPLSFDKPLNELAVDPDFDVFRIPAAGEMPPALNVLFSREPKTFVLSRIIPEGMELAWDDFADTYSFGKTAGMAVQYDDEPLPDSRVVVLLGGDNAMLSGLLERAKQPFKLTETAYTLNSINYTCGLHSLALTLQAGEQQIILLDASSPESLQTLASKLPHYSKYSYVLFNSVSGENVAKGQWPVNDSPLQFTTDP